MKKTAKLFGLIALVAVIGFSIVACDDGGGGGDPDLPGTITISPTSATVGTELTATYSGTETVSYQWKRGTTNVGTDSNKYTPDTAGSHTVTVSAAGFKSKTSAAVTVTSGGDDNGGGGGGSTTLGTTLTLNAQVYWNDSHWDNNRFNETYSPFNGTRTVTAGYEREYYNDEYDYWDWEFVSIGGSGNITNGQLSFTIGTPSYLENADDFFEYWDEQYDNFSVSPSSAKLISLSFEIPNGSLYRSRYVMTQNTDTAEAGTYEDVQYIYVDRDVTVSGRGKTETDSGSGWTETYTTRNFTLNLKEGWNTVYYKEEWSETYNPNDDTYNWTSTQTISQSNPSNIRWVIWERFDWDTPPTLPPANHTPLTSGQWTDGNFTNRTPQWYSFTATAGTTYYVWWNDSYEGNNTKTGDIDVDAWYADGTRAVYYEQDSGWDNPMSITPSSNGTVYVRAYPTYNIGTYSITFTTANTRPSASMLLAPSISSSRSVLGNEPKNNNAKMPSLFRNAKGSVK